MTDIIMSHVFHSSYTEKALNSIGSGRRIFLVDNSFCGEMKVYSRRNDHVVWIRPKVQSTIGPPFQWHPLTCADSWNCAIGAASSEWVINVNPDVYVYAGALDRVEETISALPPEVVLVNSNVGGFNLWAGRRDWLMAHPFDNRYKPCGGEDEDIQVQVAKDGKKWASMSARAVHMDGGHLNRVDGYCNIGPFIEKWGWKPHSPEYRELVGKARYSA